ncbi:MAG: DUF2460 domain-containing protein [Rhizomicrobium sp.]|jgi:hypothetical protein
MTYLLYPRAFPGLAPEITRRPKHSIELQSHQSGAEVRVSYWSEPLWEWDIAYNVLRDGHRDGIAYDELRQIEGMFLACSGSLLGFQFWDCDDHQVFQQAFATTDGLSSAYTLVRTLGANNPAMGYLGTEAIGFLDLNRPFNLYADGSAMPVSPTDPIFGYSLSTSAPKQQQIVFNEAPPAGHVLSADLSYLYYARFNADSQDFEKFMHQLWGLKKVTLVSLRFGSGGSSLPQSTSQAAGRSITVYASPLQLMNTDGYVGITNATGTTLAIDLPIYPSANQVVKLADEGGNAGTNNWMIQYDGAPVANVVVSGGFVSLRWNGDTWFQIGAQ